MSKTETQSEALELAEFFESMKKSSHRWYDGVPVHEKAAAELRRLDAENKALRIKAVRYDYLRTGGRYIVKIAQDSIYCGGHSTSEKYGPALDDAIDAAMAAAKNGGAA